MSYLDGPEDDEAPWLEAAPFIATSAICLFASLGWLRIGWHITSLIFILLAAYNLRVVWEAFHARS